ncbi:hypothetical protein KW850_19380 [Bacillus sp. sid0103]|uniref:hypothetical protein n=1 Tax=Bacillus sp. sid0103 TaxID=2856337 RepID=UPI001C46AF09|nr:hypothetical protein [Bacillus sp. sid0103]MBV7507405.1 hypothetical protein [Bacillus sp. sid0103]
MKERKNNDSLLEHGHKNKINSEQRESCETYEFNGEVYVCCCDGSGSCSCTGVALK